MSTQNILENIFEIGKIEENIRDILKDPEKILEVTIKVKTPNGKIKIFKGWRVIYNTALGPGKGGIRFHPNVTKEEITNLAFWMTIKNALFNLPFGGAKGGVNVNPKELSNFEIEQLARNYIKEIYEIIGIDKDIPAPDIYTDEKIMAIMLDEYEKIVRKKEFGMITGKPFVLLGNKVRTYSTSLGGFYVLEEALKEFNVGRRVVIQGFGNVGSNVAEILYENGFKITAVSDSKGAIYNPNGLNIHKILKVKKETGSVINYKDARVISNEELLELKTDILIPAAIENVITEKNADNIQAKLILELANGPINYKADKILNEKKIIIIPDVLANAGGVIVSYFEWIQGRIGEYWTEEYTKEKLKNKMKDTFNEVLKITKEEKITLREASYLKAIRRIEEALKYRYFLI